MISVISVFVTIFLLIFCTYRGVSILIIAPLFALLAALFGGGESLLAYYTQVFMVKLGTFTASYFPLFLISAIFGKVMDVSGCAKSIAQFISKKFGEDNSVLAVVLSCSILTYGGISLFVVVFAVYPIAIELFKKANTPKRFMPAAMALGAFSYTMTALPGTPAIQNTIPSQYLGTNTFAAPGISLICSILMFSLGMLWLNYQLKISKKRNESYSSGIPDTIENTQTKLPNFYIATLPILTVMIVNYLASVHIFPNIDTSFLSLPKFGSTTIKSVSGNWAVIAALFYATVVAIATNYKKINIKQCLNEGAINSLEPMIGISSIVGFGAVLSILPGFILMKDYILQTFDGNPIVSSAIISSLFSAVSASSSGGMSICLETMGTKYLELATAAGINPEIIHRIISLASSTGPLPHNGPVITMLTICGLTHKQSYKDIFIVVILIPLLICAFAIFINSIFGTF